MPTADQSAWASNIDIVDSHDLQSYAGIQKWLQHVKRSVRIPTCERPVDDVARFWCPHVPRSAQAPAEVRFASPSPLALRVHCHTLHTQALLAISGDRGAGAAHPWLETKCLQAEGNSEDGGQEEDPGEVWEEEDESSGSEHDDCEEGGEYV